MGRNVLGCSYHAGVPKIVAAPKLIRTSTKVHPEFDLNAAGVFFCELERELSGQLVTSPYDLYSVETLRDRHGLRTGEAFPTDIFVFGKGEPDDPSITKVGGRPYWPVDREWPANSGGMPCHFLAQFNFGDSIDLVGDDLPGSVLLLLTETPDDWIWEDSHLTFHWLPNDITPDTNLNVPSTLGGAGPFYGAIHRSVDYPDSFDIAFDLQLRRNYNLPLLNGTKIGGLPHFIQDGVETDSCFLCQLGSIQAAPRVPFPWVNQHDPYPRHGRRHP